MDIQRQGVARRKMIRRIVYIALIVIAVPLITWGLSRLKPAAPTVELATLWPDTVKRGPMIRDVHGLGTLRPEEVMWIPAAFDSRVEKIELLPGVKVNPNTVIMVLSNPQMELDANDLEWQVKIAQANYDDLKVKLENQTLDQKSTTANLKSQDVEAKLTADRDQELLKLGLKPDLDVKISVSKAQELDERYKIEQDKLAAMKQSVEAQLAAQRVTIEKLKAAWDLKKKQVEQLTIRAGTEGMLQEVPVEVGQRVPAGTILAKVAQQGKLKAELKIAETQAKDIQLGQKAEIDTRNGIIPGHVSRIDPAVINGTVTVDVKLEGKLPDGARPDLSVDGTIELERLADVVYVGRPVFGQANSVVSLFKIDPDGKGATRVQVKFGKTSVNNIEVLEGLKVGDRVILSDMSAWDAQNRIRLD